MKRIILTFVAVTVMLFSTNAQTKKGTILLGAGSQLSETSWTDLAITPKIGYFINVLDKLKKGIPIQYIIGKVYFLNTILKTNQNVLIPRPETEELVNWVLSSEKKNKKIKVLDIGTGSGCISIALKKNRSEWDVHAYEKVLMQ